MEWRIRFNTSKYSFVITPYVVLHKSCPFSHYRSGEMKILLWNFSLKKLFWKFANYYGMLEHELLYKSVKYHLDINSVVAHNDLDEKKNS